jgi:hypothetical protein
LITIFFLSHFISLNLQRIMKKNINKIIILLFLSVNLLLLSFYLIISFYNVPQSDDYFLIDKMQSLGLFESVYHWYMTWQGRYLIFIFTNLSLLSFSYFDTLILNSIFIFILYFISFFGLLKKLLNKFSFNYDIWDNVLISSFSIMLFNTLLLYHFDSSTFFWVCASQSYFTSFAFFLLGINSLLSTKKNNLSYVTLIFSFLYVGCCSELFSLIILLLLFLSIVLVFNFNYQIFKKKIILSFITCLISFLIMYFAPGTEIRIGLIEGSIEFMPLLDRVIKSQVILNNLVFNIIPRNSGYLIISFLAAVYFGVYFRLRNSRTPFNTRALMFTFFALILVLICSAYFFVIGTSLTPPSRVLVHLSGFIILTTFLFGFLVSQVFHVQSFNISFIFILLATIFLFFSTFYKFRFNLSPTIIYAKSIRENILYVKKLKSQSFKGYILIDSFRNSPKNILLNFHFNSNLKDSLKMSHNKAFERIYNLPFKIFEKP